MNKTISVSESNWERLVKRGAYNDSMDDIIGNLLDEIERTKQKLAQEVKK